MPGGPSGLRVSSDTASQRLGSSRHVTGRVTLSQKKTPSCQPAHEKSEGAGKPPSSPKSTDVRGPSRAQPMDPRGWKPRGDPGRAIRGPRADLGDTEKALSPHLPRDTVTSSTPLSTNPTCPIPVTGNHCAHSRLPQETRNLQQPRAFGSGPAPYPCRHSRLCCPGLRVCHPQPGLTACKRLRHNLLPRPEGPQVTWFSAQPDLALGPRVLGVAHLRVLSGRRRSPGLSLMS